MSDENVWNLYDEVRKRLDDLYWAMHRLAIDRKEHEQTKQLQNLKRDVISRLKEILKILDETVEPLSF